MKVFFGVIRVQTDGEVTVAGATYPNDDPEQEAIVSRGETVHCPQQHVHSKSCAQTMLDAPVPKGQTMRQKIQAWFDDYHAKPAPAALVPLPTKQVEEVDEESEETIIRHVEDKRLS